MRVRSAPGHAPVPAIPPPARDSAEVIMVGAGPVGLLLANLLGQAGIRSLVFDRRDRPLDHSMAIGVTPPSLEILRRLGLDGRFRAEGVPVQWAEVHEAGRRLGRMTFAHLRSPYPFFLSIPQARTVAILRENLERYPSVTVHEGWECVGLDPSAEQVTLGLREVGSGGWAEARASLVVGCDGYRSTVRAAAGLAGRERVYPQRFVMADFPDASGLGDEARLFFSAEASVESFPLPGGCRRWIALVTPHGEGTPLDYLIATVRGVAGFGLPAASARCVSAFGARRMVVDRYYAGRVVLAGDAAHVMSSIGGQGMNTGFADAELLAALVPGMLRDPARRAPALAAYDRIRRRAYQAAANRAERGMWLGTLRGRFASALRRRFIRQVLFRWPLAPRLAPHFTMLTIPFRNLHHLPHGRGTPASRSLFSL